MFTITHKSPKEYRFAIVSQMQNYILDAVENLYRANAVQLAQKTIVNHKHYQCKTMTAFRLLGTVDQIGSKQGAITTHQLEQIAMQVRSLTKQRCVCSISDFHASLAFAQNNL